MHSHVHATYTKINIILGILFLWNAHKSEVMKLDTGMK